MSDEKETLIGRRVRFRADFYTTRIMPPRGWTGTIEDERRSSSGQGVTSYIVLLDEPFRSQEQDPRVDTTEDEMEPSQMLHIFCFEATRACAVRRTGNALPRLR